MFGEWLFDAAFIGCDSQQCNSFPLFLYTFLQHVDNVLDKSNDQSLKRPNSIVVDTKNSINLNENVPLSPTLTIDKYESGKAEALGTLCRIICAKKTGEEILPAYLARFYLAVLNGLKISPQNSVNRECGECIVAILMNSPDLFRLDVDGVRVLLPSFINALELVLPDKDLKLVSNVNKTELRRASIHLLLSMIVLPLHFQNTPIKELISGGHDQQRPLTFGQLKPKLMNLLMNALQIETDPQNTHMLLGGLFLCVQDSAIFEKIEQIQQPITETTSTLLSSGK